jgi:tRNA nucleotidyltransferase (CCA-adding enzyme)
MKTYLVGGAVRDQLLNFPYHEKDWVVVGSSPEEMIALGYTPVGKDFPVFLHPKTHEEYALARTERKIASGYTGFTFHTDASVTLEEDLQRRDLTINAIAKNNDGDIIDPYQGQQDIQHRLLRHVSSAFNEDPVRILRVARFMARYHHLGFTVADETMQHMQEMVTQEETKHLVAERVWQECDKALTEKNPEYFFSLLKECCALNDIFPSFAEHALLPCLLKLNAACQLSTHKTIRFAAFCFPLPYGNIEKTHAYLATPNEYKELSLLTKVHYSHYASPQTWTPQLLSDFFQKTDALRKPERFQHILTTCQSIHQSEGNSHDNRQLLLNAFTAYKNVDHQSLIKQGFKKAALGEAIKEKRMEQLNQWLSKENLNANN